MKFLILSLSMFILATISNAQIVIIPDANFKNALIAEGVDTDGDGEIGFSEAAAITFLNVTEKGISDMTGIEAFTGLEDLFCGKNQLTSLDVSHNNALITLVCSENQITSLNLSNDSVLYEFSCSDNQLISLDLTYNTALQIFYCYNNQLTSLDVSKNTHLWRLDCSVNQLASLDVSKDTVLEELICFNNQLTSLDVSESINLKYLYCYQNDLVSLNVSNISLIILNCSENKLSSLNISDSHLTNFDCSINQLSSIVVSNCAYLLRLNCSNNKLTNLDLQINTYLEYLYCNNNLLTSLNIINNTHLQLLDISFMPDLYKVCVWSVPFPPNDISLTTTESPNVYFTTNCLATDLNIPEVNDKLNIYPNPSDDIVNIEIENIDNTILEIYDVNGMLVYSKQPNSKSEKIDISGFSKGVYLVKVKQDKSFMIGRIVKK